ncbi:MAG: 4-oxalocrotonate tautomerase family protein [Desulfovibrio sp.]|jgi:4-oxalocrotonate tautomerase|nr:4-oxalocrotonate tautomerase family protein [Desulfovibrio desulfuricans]MBO6171400.1 4-oxalocrotonate tautomerase family protein [Desulfovibrio sp.]
MPVVTFEAAGLSIEQKRQLATEFTETAARVTGLPKETIFVFLKENSADNVGVGGVLLSDRHGRSAN